MHVCVYGWLGDNDVGDSVNNYDCNQMFVECCDMRNEKAAASDCRYISWILAQAENVEINVAHVASCGATRASSLAPGVQVRRALDRCEFRGDASRRAQSGERASVNISTLGKAVAQLSRTEHFELGTSCSTDILD